MKTSKILLIAVFQVILIMTNACATSHEMDAEPYLTKTFTMDGPGELQVQTSGGSIDVSSHEGNKVVVEMYVRKGGRSINPGDNEIKEELEDYEIEIEKVSNKVIASAKRESGNWFGNNNISISFKVYVPVQTSCDLDTSGGSISLEGVKGEQVVETSGGSLDLEDIEGDMKAHTSGGSIDIENYAGILEANTSGGSIDVDNAEGEITLHTSGGSIDLENMKGSITASTSGGGIEADIQTLEKQLRLSTSGGSITAVIPNGLGLDLDLKGSRVNTKLSNFSGEAEKNRIVGTMNGGGIPVELSTSGGSVNLEYR